ncbi:MAG: AraC family transcriptional regulator [Nannocystaceae bacterium]
MRGPTPRESSPQRPAVTQHPLTRDLGWAELSRSQRLWSGVVDTCTISAIHDGASVWRIGGAERLTRGGGLRFKREGDHFRTVEVLEASAMTVLKVGRETLARLGLHWRARVFNVPQCDDAAAYRAFMAIGDGAEPEEALLALLTHLAPDLPSLAPARRGSRVDLARVRALLDARFAESHSLTDLAERAGMHPVSLVRLFREEYGLPPRAYLIERRVEEAQRLLAQNVPAAEVAGQVGFFDQSHLHRHFKRRVGLTPREYARREGVALGE